MRSVVTDWIDCHAFQFATKIVLVKKAWSGPTHGVGPEGHGAYSLCV